MAEENINLIDTYYLPKVEKDFIDNSNLIKTLNDNHIDSNELLGIDKDKDAGTIKLKYEDEKEKEADGISFLEGLWEFTKDLPPSTYQSLKLAGVNGADVVVNMVPLIDRLFSLDPNYKTNQPLMDTMKNWSNHLAASRKQIKEIRDGNVKAAQFVGMVFQDVPYAVPLHKFFKNTGMPKWMAMPLAWGMGYALGFDEEKVSMFLNSKDMQAIKHLVKIIPDTPEDKLFDNVWQTLEGTSMMWLFPELWKGIKFAKRNIPKLNTKEIGQTVAIGGTTLATAAAVSGKAQGDEIPPIPEPININEKPTIDVSDSKLMQMGMVNPKLAVEFLKAGGKKVQELRKLKGGTGRAVFELDNEKVIKIAKKQRGLRENELEGDFVVKNWLPKFHTSGRDYVVVENVARADSELRRFLKPLQKFSQDDFDKKIPELQEALTKMELGDFMNFNVAWGDFIASRNWGKTKDGRFVLLDAGALDIDILKKTAIKYKSINEPEDFFKGNYGKVKDYQDVLQKDWDQLLADRRAAGMGKFVIVLTAGGKGYRILDNQQNNIISKQTENK